MAADNQGNSGSTTFTWNVTYVNQSPTLDNPGNQVNKPGDVVSVQLSGYDVDGDTVSYSATGLPSGLTIASTTGLISGTLSATSGSKSVYNVTVKASDGTYSASQTFKWYVSKEQVKLTNPGDQINTEGDTVSLQLSATDANKLSLTYADSGLPPGLSISSSGLISGKVSSGDSANGPYTVTVSATDSNGYSASQQFTWNINAPSTLMLTNPGNQTNAEGDNVSLQVQASDPDGDTLEYGASGLPIGLVIDPQTGLIQGTVDYSAAETSGGSYAVTVTVNDGNGQTVSQSFVWTITDTEQGPWLQYPEFQDSQTGTAASLQLVGGSPDGKTLTYSATGLPSGLTVNATTGLISGTIMASAGSYSVTATVSDGILQASQTFTWQVTSGSAPQVLFSFDGRPVGDDGLAGVDPATPESVLVTLQSASAGLHTVQISIPSGKSALNESSFQLANGGSTTLQLTPELESQSFDDVLLVSYVDSQEAGDGKGTNVEVKIAGSQKNGKIRADDTPAAMKNRVPPMNSKAKDPSPFTEVTFTITPTLKDAKVVVFQVNGNSMTDGTAYLLNAEKQTVENVKAQKSGVLDVIGKVQTAPSMTDGKPDGKGGNAGKLLIAAYPGTKNKDGSTSWETTKVLAQSAGFSVAAIPIKVIAQKPVVWHPFTDEYQKDPATGLPSWAVYWGPVYPLTFVSDSGNNDDLNAVYTGETLKLQNEPTGFYANYTVPKDLNYTGITADKQGADNNMYGKKVQKNTEAEAIKATVEIIQGEINKTPSGTLILDQTEVFADARTGTGTPLRADQQGGLPILASGFQLVEIMQKTKAGKYTYHVSRTAQAVGDVKAGEVAEGVKPVTVEIKVVPTKARD